MLDALVYCTLLIALFIVVRALARVSLWGMVALASVLAWAQYATSSYVLVATVLSIATAAAALECLVRLSRGSGRQEIAQRRAERVVPLRAAAEDQESRAAAAS